jgi:MYND finger
MSLLPIAVVVVAFFLLFRLLGQRTQKSKEPQLPPAPQTPPPSDTPQEKQDQEPAPPGHLASPDGLASFHFESKSYPKPATISPPRRHPCRVCGVPSTKRCLRCRSAYYCSREHSLQASLRRVHRTSLYYVSNIVPQKKKNSKRIGGRTNHTACRPCPAVAHPRGAVRVHSPMPKSA